MVFQPTGLWLSQLYSPISIFINQLEWLYSPIKVVPFEPIKLQGFEVLIYMKMNQSWSRGVDFYFYKSACLWFSELIVSFHWSLYFPIQSRNTKDENTEGNLLEQSRVDSAGQSRADHTRVGRADQTSA